MITQIIKLNLVPGKVLPRANVVQYDFGSRNLEFQIWDGEQRFILTGAMTARIQGTKPDRLGFDYAATVDTTNNIITADLTQQMTPVSGEVMCEIVIKKTGERIGTLNFVLVVQPAALNEATSTSESDLPDIIAMAEAQMHQCMASATEAKSYAEGGTNTRPGEDTDNAKYYKEQADASAQAADGSANDAAADALKAEGHANGKQNGQAVSSTSPYYHNNAEYFKDQAEAAAQDAAQWSGNPPYIGANGHWWIYNTTTHAFVDSGIDASITVQIADITMLAYGSSPYVTNTGTATDPIFHLFIPRGSSVTGCTKTSTSELVDTYTMTFSDGYSTTFTVANGRGISNITKTGTSGLVDTYTITYNDGTTSTYTVTNGRDGIGSQISSLSDVDITSPATDDGLVYNGTSGKWENKALADVAFSGAYGDLSNTPTLGTAASKNVPASGNASTTQVVMGDDTRLTDARNAADVSAWAKASSKPAYKGNEIKTKVAQTGTAQSSVTSTIGANTTMDNAVGELLNNDVTLSSEIQALTNDVGDKNGLTTDVTTDLVTAINSVDDKADKNTSYIGIVETINGTAKSDYVTGDFVLCDDGHIYKAISGITKNLSSITKGSTITTDAVDTMIQQLSKLFVFETHQNVVTFNSSAVPSPPTVKGRINIMGKVAILSMNFGHNALNNWTSIATVDSKYLPANETWGIMLGNNNAFQAFVDIDVYGIIRQSGAIPAASSNTIIQIIYFLK